MANDLSYGSLYLCYKVFREMKRLINILIFVVLPISIGGLIYIISRSKSLKIFKWFEKVNMSNEVALIRDQFSIFKLPNWIRYNLPDLLWVFSFTSLLFLIWNMKISKESIVYLVIPMGLGIISELGQLFSIVNGTFDKLDLFFYLLGGLFSIYIISKLKSNNNEKTTTSPY